MKMQVRTTSSSSTTFTKLSCRARTITKREPIPHKV